MMNDKQRAEVMNLLRAIADAVIAAVEAGGAMGTPGGTLYATLMAHGCTIQQFESIMAGLVAAKKLEKRGQLYFIPKAGV